MIVGAPYFHVLPPTLKEGAAFLYPGSSIGGFGGISTADRLVANGDRDAGQNYPGLGYTVAMVGDLDDDLNGDVAVGAPYYSNGESHEGMVFFTPRPRRTAS